MARFFDPYRAADGIDTKLNILIQRYPITIETKNQWLLFIRTLESSLTVIKSRIKSLS